MYALDSRVLRGVRHRLARMKHGGRSDSSGATRWNRSAPLRNNLLKALLPIVGLVFGSICAVSSAWAGACGRDYRADCYSVWGVCLRAYTYVEDPQVFRSEYRPRFSYGVMLCPSRRVLEPQSRVRSRSWRGQHEVGSTTSRRSWTELGSTPRIRGNVTSERPAR